MRGCSSEASPGRRRMHSPSPAAYRILPWNRRTKTRWGQRRPAGSDLVLFRPAEVHFFPEHGALWFSRADLLGDPLEGSLTRAREAERQKYLANPPEGRTREELEKVFAHNASIYADMVHCAFVNCWHLGNHESMAMWQGYGGGPYGVAVRSTFGKLAELLPPAFGSVPMGTIFVGRIRYIEALAADAARADALASALRLRVRAARLKRRSVRPTQNPLSVELRAPELHSVRAKCPDRRSVRDLLHQSRPRGASPRPRRP